MTSPFSRRVIALLTQVPRGKVTSYGAVAAHAGNNRGAREVARILHSSTERYTLPWHRIVNKQGCIVLSGEGFVTQRTLLENEGIPVADNGCIPSSFFWDFNDVTFDNDDYEADDAPGL